MDVDLGVAADSTDGAAAKRAQAAFAKAMAGDADSGLLVPSGSIEGWFDEARAFYAPYRDRLLTPSQREKAALQPWMRPSTPADASGVTRRSQGFPSGGGSGIAPM